MLSTDSSFYMQNTLRMNIPIKELAICPLVAVMGTERQSRLQSTKGGKNNLETYFYARPA